MQTPASHSARQPQTPPQEAFQDRLALLVIWAAVTFNAGLALVNAHIFSMTTAHVQVVQLAITAAAVGLGLARGLRTSPLLALAIAVFLYCCGVSVITTGSFDAKTIYDVLMVAAFVALGSTMRRVPAGFVHALMLVAALVAAFEFMLPALYTLVFDPLAYFGNTRAWVAAAVADSLAEGPGLYLGSMRGSGESWLGLSVAGHRVGGLFLEPLSQGYFAVVGAIVYGHIYRHDLAKRIAATVFCGLLALMSDTRTALLLIAFVFVAYPVVRRLPVVAALFVPVGGFLAGLALHSYFQWTADPSEFAYRMHLTYGILLDSTPFNLLFGDLDMTYAADSGIVSIMSRAGPLGLLAAYAIASGLVGTRRPEAGLVILAMVYLFVTSIFGAAFLSIKTVAFLAFLISAAGVQALRPVPPRRLGAAPQQTPSRGVAAAT